MTKLEIISYISTNNPGFFKTRKNHIKNISPNTLIEIEEHTKNFNLTPIHFSDSLYYYLNDITIQNKCKICGKIIGIKSQYCSNICKKQDVTYILNKTRKTLFEKNGSSIRF